jgi:hypothetical protein
MKLHNGFPREDRVYGPIREQQKGNKPMTLQNGLPRADIPVPVLYGQIARCNGPIRKQNIKETSQ